MAISAILKGRKSARKSRDAQRAAERDAASAKKIGADEWEWFKKNIRPILNTVTGQAQSGELPSLYADRAAADVTRSYGQAEKGMLRQQQRYGIDPSSPRSMEVLRNINLTRAAAEAGARTSGRRDAEAMNWSRRIQAAALGRGIPQFAQGALMDSSRANQQFSAAHGQDAANMTKLAVTLATGAMTAGMGGAGGAAGALGSIGGSSMQAGQASLAPQALQMSRMGGNNAPGFNGEYF